MAPRLATTEAPSVSVHSQSMVIIRIEATDGHPTRVVW